MTTFLILLLFAVIFLVAGGALLYLRNKNKQKATLMGQTGTSDVSRLAPGTLVEVKGTVRCEEPSPPRWPVRGAPTTRRR